MKEIVKILCLNLKSLAIVLFKLSFRFTRFANTFMSIFPRCDLTFAGAVPSITTPGTTLEGSDRNRKVAEQHQWEEFNDHGDPCPCNHGKLFEIIGCSHSGAERIQSFVCHQSVE